MKTQTIYVILLFLASVALASAAGGKRKRTPSTATRPRKAAKTTREWPISRLPNELNENVYSRLDTNDVKSLNRVSKASRNELISQGRGNALLGRKKQRQRELAAVQSSVRNRGLKLKDAKRHQHSPYLATEEEFSRNGGSRLNRLFENEKLEESNVAYLSRKARKNSDGETTSVVTFDGKRRVVSMKVDPKMEEKAEPIRVRRKQTEKTGHGHPVNEYRTGPMKTEERQVLSRSDSRRDQQVRGEARIPKAPPLPPRRSRPVNIKPVKGNYLQDIASLPNSEAAAESEGSQMETS